MRRIPLGLVLAAAAACSPVLAATSSFDTAGDTEGWVSAYNGGEPVVWVDGAIRVDDNTTEWAYLQAPVAFLAPIATGGSFSFDLWHQATEGERRPYGVRLAITGADTTLIAELDAPTDTRTTYRFDLTEAQGWRIATDVQQPEGNGTGNADLATLGMVLGQLQGVYISADYSDSNKVLGGTDRTFIDNVQLLAAPVPEPQPWAMLAAGVMALGWLSHRRSS